MMNQVANCAKQVNICSKTESVTHANCAQKDLTMTSRVVLDLVNYASLGFSQVMWVVHHVLSVSLEV